MRIWSSMRSFFGKLVFHPDPIKRFYITLTYIGIGLLGNFFLLQVFCVPVLWAAIYFALFIGVVMASPLLIIWKWANLFAALILGAGIPLCLYLAVFLADPWEGFGGYIFYTEAILLGGIGLVAFIPFYLLYHIVRYYNAAKDKSWRRIFWIGCLTPLMALMISPLQFRRNDLALSKVLLSGDSISVWHDVAANYFTERLTGIGFKYHTKLEFIYDGWRPPLHDPLLNIYLWIYSKTYFPQWPMSRLKVYSILFPQEPIWIDCSCAFTHDVLTYFQHDTAAFTPRREQ